MEIFKTFGLDPVLTIAQIVNFLVVLYVLKRYLYKPLLGAVKKREELARETVKNAEESSDALEKAKKEEEKIIKEAQETARQIVSDAKEQSTTMIKHAQEETKVQTDKMIKDAKTQIEVETAEAQQELNNYVLKLSLEILRKSLSNVISEKEQNVIVEKAMKEMQKLPN